MQSPKISEGVSVKFFVLDHVFVHDLFDYFRDVV